MSDKIKNNLINIFQTVFTVPGEEIILMTRENSDKWDSMAHTSLVLCLEEEFGLKINFETSEELNSFEYILEFILSEQ